MVKKVIILLPFIILLFAGCATSDPKIEYKYVSKPVLVCPSPQDLNGGKPIPQRPDLEIFKLTDKSTPDEVAKAYQITVKQLQGHTNILYKLLMSYDRTSEEYKKIKKVIDTLYPDGAIIPPKTN